MTIRRHARPPSYVVVGASAGGLAALSQIFKQLPSDFPGAILVVLHVPENSGMTWLRDRLSALGHLPVKTAEEGEIVRQGTAYVAPPGKHLVVSRDRIHLSSGPREQHVRPAIDVLFRSAAQAHGKQVIGLILTGMLADGALGLRAVSEAGGITIVQNPEEAEQGDMPRNAMRDLNVDYCLSIAEIGPLLDLLVRRAGSAKQGILETGLASSMRFLKERVALLDKLYAQSRKNPKTARFLEAEIAALTDDVAQVQGMIPRKGAEESKAKHAAIKKSRAKASGRKARK